MCCYLLLHTGENPVFSGTAKGSLPVAKRELGVMVESPEMILEVCQINASVNGKEAFGYSQIQAFLKHLEMNLFQCSHRFWNEIPIPASGHDKEQCHHLSNTRFNLQTLQTTCRQVCWLWIQVLQATDGQWEISSLLPGIYLEINSFLPTTITDPKVSHVSFFSI